MRATDALAATIAATLDPAATRQDPDATIAPSVEPPARGVARAAPPVRRLGYIEGEELGRGGLGRVLSATQQVFDRDVAIKRLLAAGDHVTAMRFFAEALIAAQLEHPNIVPIHDLLADDAGTLSLVMKRVEGRSWKAVLAAKPARPLDEHLEILLKVCEAVEFAHSRGIVHRDLKPENVMIGDFGEVAVMDWGCAVAFGDRQHHPVVPRVEEVDRISGTPAYMAPEMVLISPNRIGPASDVYLLGAILYEVLTGTRVHRGDSVYAVLRHAAGGEIDPPRERAPDRAIPDELAQIALSALHADPAQRTASAAALAAQLRGYRRHAQAVTLAEHARAHLAKAAKLDATRADAALRRAASAAENAAELWPDWQPGRALRAQTTLAWAKHCLATGGFTQARALATQAGEAARAADDDRAAHEAAALGKRAVAGEAAARAHARKLRAARLGAIAAAVVVAVVSIAGYTAVSGERRRAVAALDESERARKAVVAEQEARVRDQRRFAPGLLAQARDAIAAGDFAGAADDLAGAIEFDPQRADAAELAADVAASLGRWGAARDAIARLRRLVPDPPGAADLDRLCASAGKVADDVLATRVAAFFLDHGKPLLAQRKLLNPEQRLAAYRQPIDAAWPGLGAHLGTNADGRVWLEWGHEFMGRKDLVDLSPLAGIPFAGLNLSGTQVEDLAPLAGMPLDWLNLRGSLVRDLGPLTRTKLHALDVRDCAKLDVATVRGLPVSQLALNPPTLTNLEPLRGLALEDLDVGGSFTDLTPVLTPRLRKLRIASQRPVVLGTVGDLEILGLHGSPIADPQALARVHPQQLELTWYEQMPDLRAMDSSRCGELDLVSMHAFDAALLPRNLAPSKVYCGWCDIDLSGLMRTSIARLGIDHVGSTTWASLDALRSAPIATIALGDREMAAEQFWKRYHKDVVGILLMDGETDVATPLPAVARPGGAPGLRCQVIPDVRESVDEIASRTASSTIDVEEPSLAPLGQANNTGLRFTGVISVPTDGRYEFTLTSDDGSRLLIDDHVVVDDDGAHADVTRTGRAHLAAGAHRVTLLYFQAIYGTTLRLSVAAPGEQPHPVPKSWWSH